ncbi:LOW QUALITY PROTEIN: filament-like plant protein 4 [Dioscorea cayenensis subsp. rotundata]|uniref:LOW QUALITY PROTEIN: filament-like plant protein 4 n=1 Tax=Dioscorea cayennensis subsp. rotundata TaxID=55577 RepID=A0AB40B420_DIOCR|nr:LOW QUALITY PROTEIN: filament-like plant protein 4 [Dioscorea cayenensis subsp. rotundata]
MDKRSWPWKKKSSEKAAAAAAATADSVSSSDANQADQPSAKSVNYVQISAETYNHLTELEDQVKVLNEKLTSAQSEITNKDVLVKQHAKVAEEAVTGWEKAEEEALALKQQLESVTLLKLRAEDRASHLDGALKECMKQVRNVKEESEQKLHDVIFAKTKQWEKVKSELEARIHDFEEELLRASAENAALSRSLQERSNMLMKVSDEKSQADAEIEVLKSNLQSCEREISSLKYELHIASKELEIRNEEKNMSVRSADVANKQHVEDVKKITKLEAECQRLRGLVRKKLPGPAALAQMKLEVENLGRDYSEPRGRRSSARSSSPHFAPASEFAYENFQQCRKENEFLTARLLAMEEETKMLKEALANRNSELQVSRDMCASTANKLLSMEAEMNSMNQQKGPLKTNMDITVEHSFNNSKPPSLTSMSEDGIDEEGSESWATALVSGLSQIKKERDAKKADNGNHLDLMDDFLEMERLACLSTEANVTTTPSENGIDKKIAPCADAIHMVQKDGNEDDPTKLQSSCKKQLERKSLSIFESQSPDTDLNKVVEDIRSIVQDVQEELSDLPVSCVIQGSQSMVSPNQKHYHEDVKETKENVKSSKQISKSLKNAISQIHEFVLMLGKEAVEIQGRSPDEFNKKLEKFSESVSRVLSEEVVLDEFIMAFSHILSETSELSFNLLRNKRNEEEGNSSDYVDKVTLLENKVAQHDPTKERFSGASLDSHSLANPGIEGPVGHDYDLMNTLEKCSFEELEQLKLEKKNMEMDLARCTESLECTKIQLVQTEQHLSELKSELAACQKSYSLAETQLKCMAESYKSLESRTQELESEIDQLRMKAETLDDELQEEKRCHQDDLVKYIELQEKDGKKCATCSIPVEGDSDIKTKQEKEIAAAAEKLAECQETIFLLSKQLNAMRPPAELMASSLNDGRRMSDGIVEDEPSSSGFHPRSLPSPQQSDYSETEKVGGNNTRITGGESPLDGYMIPSDNESTSFPRSPVSSKRQKAKVSRSSSSSSISSMMVTEKHGRGFSRFFSKSKNDH